MFMLAQAHIADTSMTHMSACSLQDQPKQAGLVTGWQGGFKKPHLKIAAMGQQQDRGDHLCELLVLVLEGAGLNVEGGLEILGYAVQVCDITARGCWRRHIGCVAHGVGRLKHRSLEGQSQQQSNHLPVWVSIAK